MPRVPPVAAYSFVVQLGHAVGEPVEGARLKMHEALAATVVDAKPAQIHAPRETQYLSFGRLSSAPARIKELLQPATEVPDDAFITIDLAGTPYDLLGERLLFHLAHALADIVEGTSRTVLVLLPKSPPDGTSLLWPRLLSLDTEGWVLIADGEGAVRAFGAQPSPSLHALKTEIRRHRGKLTAPLQQRFERKVMQRLGHFRSADSKGNKGCARFHYDCSLAEAELTGLLDAWLRRTLKTKAERAGATFVLCGVTSGWMLNAVMIVAGRHGMTYKALPARPKVGDVRELPADRKLLLVFDVVSSGATLGSAVKAMTKAGVAPQPQAFAALAMSKNVLTSGPLTAEAIAFVRHGFTRLRDCPQCGARLPHDSRAKPERQLRISTFDMWTMLTDVTWAPEAYGPEGQPRYPYLPDFGEVFTEYGNWVAFRYGLLLHALGRTTDVVVVCPDEPAVQELVGKLRLRFEDRLVAVAVSRQLINEIAAKRVKPADVERGAAEEPTEDWELQLRQLRESGTSVVVIDEFAASGGTAQAMIDLLKAFKIEVAAYLPFLDFNTKLELRGGVPLHTIYELPNPRPT